MAVLFPGRRQLTRRLVVTSQSVDSRFDQNETEFGVLILSVTFQMLSDGHGLLDQVVEIFGNFWRETYADRQTISISSFWQANLQDKTKKKEGYHFLSRYGGSCYR